jgi:hypothetical protein
MKNKGLPGLFALALVLSACSLVNKSTPDTYGVDQTAIAQTVVVLQTQLAVQPTTEIQATAPLAPTATAVLTPAIIPTAMPVVTEGPRFKAGPVSDVTIIDNTVVQPGATFIKTWRVENSGTGTWGSNFKIVFVSGNAMGGPASQTLGKTVAPGEAIDIPLSLTAPTVLDTHRGNWMLETDSGTRFGLGVNADQPFWVQIVVKKIFAVTNAVPNGPASWSGTCPGMLPLTAAITSDAPGTVTYYYVINGSNSPTLSSTFTTTGTSTTAVYNTNVTANGSLVIQVYIDDPNHQLFTSTLTIPVTCTP